MTVFVRTSLRLFALANPLYIRATVTFYDVDANGARLATKPTLYAAPTGTATLANPQTLDGDGKLLQPVYHEAEMAAVVTQASIADHTTGVIRPGEVSDTQTLSFAGDPNGNVGADVLGRQLWDTTNKAQWVATTAGTPATAIWTREQSGNTLIPTGLSVARTLAAQAALSPHFNVKDPEFGAKGDDANDDTAEIQAAIDAAAAAGGGIVVFPPGTYRISATLLISTPNVYLVGSGSGRGHDIGSLITLVTTWLKWTGALNGQMVKFQSPAGALNQKMTGGGMARMGLDANALADRGVLVESWDAAIFHDLFLLEFLLAGFELNVIGTLGEPRDTQRCELNDMFFRQYDQIGKCLVFDGDASANASLNTSYRLDMQHNNGIGLDCRICDNNHFYSTRQFRKSGGTANGIRLRAAATLNQACNSNQFIGTSPSQGGVYAEGTPTNTFPSVNNNFAFWDDQLGTNDVTREAGATAPVMLNEGLFTGYSSSKFAMGDTIAAARLALAALGTHTAVIYNASSNHLSLIDGTNDWNLNIDATQGDLRFARVAGTGSINLGSLLKAFGGVVQKGDAGSGGVGLSALAIPD